MTKLDDGTKSDTPRRRLRRLPRLKRRLEKPRKRNDRLKRLRNDNLPRGSPPHPNNNTLILPPAKDPDTANTSRQTNVLHPSNPIPDPIRPILNLSDGPILVPSEVSRLNPSRAGLVDPKDTARRVMALGRHRTKGTKDSLVDPKDKGMPLSPSNLPDRVACNGVRTLPRLRANSGVDRSLPRRTNHRHSNGSNSSRLLHRLPLFKRLVQKMQSSETCEYAPESGRCSPFRFSQFDSSRSGSLNSYDLERLLAKDATMEAREDCVKMLMNIFDTDRSGSINFQEFEGLYRYIQVGRLSLPLSSHRSMGLRFPSGSHIMLSLAPLTRRRPGPR